MMLFPLVFMLHEYEEIIMFKRWLKDNRNELKKRFPRFEQLLASRQVFDYSTATFAIGTAHEFILVALISICSVWLEGYHWWFAAFIGYFIHLLVHLAQWFMYQKYIPAIITTLLTLPYCVYAFIVFSNSSLLSKFQMLSWGVIGVILMVLSLQSAFFFMGRYYQWYEKHKWGV